MNNYQITEMCPHCENEVTMNWDVEMYGYQAYCPYCGKRLMLCDECTHSDNDIAGGCDYDSSTDKCSRQKSSRRKTPLEIAKNDTSCRNCEKSERVRGVLYCQVSGKLILPKFEDVCCCRGTRLKGGQENG
jgi:hypothetical protein|nr:MAG TPA: zinc-ribbon domain protein [Caudoviricetes sp.]